MQKMPKNPPGLRQRHQAWEVRRRVPEDIRATFGKREVVRPLGTRDKDDALRKYFDVAKGIQADFDKHRAELKGTPVVATSLPAPSELPPLTPAQRRKACADYYARRMDEHRLKRHELLKRAKADPKAFFAEARVDALALSRLSFWEDAIKGDQISIEGAVYHVTAHEDAKRRQAIERAHLISDSQEFFDATPETLAYKDRVTLALDLMVTELKVLRDLEVPSYLLPAPETAPTVVSVAAPAPTGPDFDTALKKWLNQSNGQRWTSNRKQSNESTALDFAEVVGKRPITAYTLQDGADFKDTIAALPPNWRKVKALRGLGLKGAVEHAKKTQAEPAAAATINAKLGVVRQFFEWCAAHYPSFEIKNPVSPKLKVEKTQQANEEWDPFSDEQLVAIFNTPPFRGAVSDKDWKTPGPNVLRESWKFWLPVLGLYTGARLNELCQLTRAHIREHDGAHYIALTKELRLKEKSSLRNIPIHADLIAFGFLDFVAKRDGRLFSDLKPTGDGLLSNVPSKWFNERLLDGFGIRTEKTDKTSFKSFRHNFAAAATQCGVAEDVRERILGHALDGLASRYGKNYAAEQQDMGLMLLRRAAMQKVKFTGLDLAHLKA